jgi:hypothetical protein
MVGFAREKKTAGAAAQVAGLGRLTLGESAAFIAEASVAVFGRSSAAAMDQSSRKP